MVEGRRSFLEGHLSQRGYALSHRRMRGEQVREVKRLILTASGGPFRQTPVDRMREATVEEALAHPTWQMGSKITIDSATLMNKGLEVIEAGWLFGFS